MNLVDRLKTFIQSHNISISQFADSCDIPRPTMSQLLNGRNKKVSDELIRKIHSAYPDVSILWLMFGEGPMLISTPNPSVNTDTKLQPSSILFEMPSSIIQEESPSDSANAIVDSSESLFDDSNRSIDEKTNDEESLQSGLISFSDSPTKKIVSIIVYYSDNSFESFGPTLPQ